MLRILFIAALLLNALVFAFTQGWLDSVTGLRARGDSDPARWFLGLVLPVLWMSGWWKC